VWLRMLRDSEAVSVQFKTCKVPAFGREIVTFSASFPSSRAAYTMAAELTDGQGNSSAASRFKVK